VRRSARGLRTPNRDGLKRPNVFDRRLSAAILSIDPGVREPQRTEEPHLGHGRKGA
jgi:hypothetical protein